MRYYTGIIIFGLLIGCLLAAGSNYEHCTWRGETVPCEAVRADDDPVEKLRHLEELIRE